MKFSPIPMKVTLAQSVTWQVGTLSSRSPYSYMPESTSRVDDSYRGNYWNRYVITVYALLQDLIRVGLFLGSGSALIVRFIILR